MEKPGKIAKWIGAGALYVVVCYGLKQVPFYTDLASGLRLALLLLLPIRRWPLLLFCDAVALTLFTAPRFGIAPFTTLSALITIFGYPLTSVPAALLARKLGFDLSQHSPRQVFNLAAVASVAALVGSLVGIAYVLSCDMSLEAQSITIPSLFETYAIGKVLGVLAVVPAAVWIASMFNASKAITRARLAKAFHDLYTWIGATSGVLLIATVLANSVGPGRLLLPIRLAMFMALVICALTHGARGAGIAVLLVNIALELTQQIQPREPDLVTVHELSALFSMVALLVGAHVSRHQAEALAASAEKDRLMAETRLAELNKGALRRLAQSHADLPQRLLDAQAGFLDELLLDFTHIENQLRDKSLDREEAQQLWWRLSSRTRQEIRARKAAIRPELLDSHGLRAALASGPIAAALYDSGIPFHVRLAHDLSRIPKATQFAVYQLAHGSIARFLQAGVAGCVTLRVRTGRLASREWVAVHVNVALNSAMEQDMENGADISRSLTLLAQAYGGRAREKPLRFGRYDFSAVLFNEDLGTLLDTDASERLASA